MFHLNYNIPTINKAEGWSTQNYKRAEMEWYTGQCALLKLNFVLGEAIEAQRKTESETMQKVPAFNMHWSYNSCYSNNTASERYLRNRYLWLIACITYVIFNLFAYFHFLCAVNHFTSEIIPIWVPISILLLLFSSNFYFHFKNHSYFEFSYTKKINFYFNIYFNYHIPLCTETN